CVDAFDDVFGGVCGGAFGSACGEVFGGACVEVCVDACAGDFVAGFVGVVAGLDNLASSCCMLRPTWPRELELVAAGGSSFTVLVSPTILAPASLNAMLYSKFATPWDVVLAPWNL